MTTKSQKRRWSFFGAPSSVAAATDPGAHPPRQEAQPSPLPRRTLTKKSVPSPSNGSPAPSITRNPAEPTEEEDGRGKGRFLRLCLWRRGEKTCTAENGGRLPAGDAAHSDTARPLPSLTDGPSDLPRPMVAYDEDIGWQSAPGEAQPPPCAPLPPGGSPPEQSAYMESTAALVTRSSSSTSIAPQIPHPHPHPHAWRSFSSTSAVPQIPRSHSHDRRWSATPGTYMLPGAPVEPTEIISMPDVTLYIPPRQRKPQRPPATPWAEKPILPGVPPWRPPQVPAAGTPVPPHFADAPPVLTGSLSPYMVSPASERVPWPTEDPAIPNSRPVPVAAESIALTYQRPPSTGPRPSISPGSNIAPPPLPSSVPNVHPRRHMRVNTLPTLADLREEHPQDAAVVGAGSSRPRHLLDAHAEEPESRYQAAGSTMPQRKSLESHSISVHTGRTSTPDGVSRRHSRTPDGLGALPAQDEDERRAQMEGFGELPKSSLKAPVAMPAFVAGPPTAASRLWEPELGPLTFHGQKSDATTPITRSPSQNGRPAELHSDHIPAVHIGNEAVPSALIPGRHNKRREATEVRIEDAKPLDTAHPLDMSGPATGDLDETAPPDPACREEGHQPVRRQSEPVSPLSPPPGDVQGALQRPVTSVAETLPSLSVTPSLPASVTPTFPPGTHSQSPEEQCRLRQMVHGGGAGLPSSSSSSITAPHEVSTTVSTRASSPQSSHMLSLSSRPVSAMGPLPPFAQVYTPPPAPPPPSLPPLTPPPAPPPPSLTPPSPSSISTASWTSASTSVEDLSLSEVPEEPTVEREPSPPPAPARPPPAVPTRAPPAHPPVADSTYFTRASSAVKAAVAEVVTRPAEAPFPPPPTRVPPPPPPRRGTRRKPVATPAVIAPEGVRTYRLPTRSPPPPPVPRKPSDTPVLASRTSPDALVSSLTPRTPSAPPPVPGLTGPLQLYPVGTWPSAPRLPESPALPSSDPATPPPLPPKPLSYLRKQTLEQPTAAELAAVISSIAPFNGSPSGGGYHSRHDSHSSAGASPEPDDVHADAIADATSAGNGGRDLYQHHPQRNPSRRTKMRNALAEANSGQEGLDGARARS